MQPIIVIGAGLAGYTFAREFRKQDKTTPLTLITADDGGFYSKPMLSNAFALKQRPEQLVTKTAAQMAEQLNINIVSRSLVMGVNAEQKKLHTENQEYAFDKLVMAVGAQPIRLALKGSAAHQVLSVNHLDHYANFRAQLETLGATPNARITILGAGLIGCEFANDLAATGYKVTLVDPGALPLAALAPPAISRELHHALISLGVEMRLGVTAQSIDEANKEIEVSLSDGSKLTADLVLSAVGLRPDVTLAQKAQLRINRGIVVDEFGRTSHPDIYALGDCAEYTISEGMTRTLPYVAPVMNASRAIASTLSGKPIAIDMSPAPVLVKTPVYPVAVVAPPVNAAEKGHWIEEKLDQRTICRFFDDRNVMLGFGVAPHDMAIRQALMSQLGRQAQATK